MSTESSAGRAEKFLQAVQAYYGKYSSPLIAKLVAKWIDNHPDLDIGMFFELLTNECLICFLILKSARTTYSL